jgi:hypothetical protein
MLSSKRENDKVLVETLVDYDELVQLRGEFDDVHIFSEKSNNTWSRISGRGKNFATKYFLIPTELRKDIPCVATGPVMCQRINTTESAIFIYVIKKIDSSEKPKISIRSMSKEVTKINITEPQARMIEEKLMCTGRYA